MYALQLILSLSLLITYPSAEHKAGQSQSNSSANDLKPESLSPYLIELYIDLGGDVALKQIWRLLKVEIPDGMSYRCGGGCSAETFNINFSDEDGKTVALKISFESGEFYQYLIFKRVNGDSNKEEWRFIGNIDSQGQPYAPPVHRVERADNQTWFVVREMWSQDSSTLARGEVWYQIKEKGLKQVLSYPIEGHNKPCRKRLGRSYKSIILRHGLENGVYTVPIQFLVSYNISDCDKGSESRPLFSKARKARYIWNGEKERFVLDISQSDIYEKEIGSLYSSEGVNYAEFLEYNFKELSNLAEAGDVEQRDWLKRFLIDIPDGARKTVLLNTLQQ